MVDRDDFERFLDNNYHCWRERRGGDIYIYRRNGGRVVHGTFGGHQRREVPPGMVRRVLLDLEFTQNQIDTICDEFGIR